MPHREGKIEALFFEPGESDVVLTAKGSEEEEESLQTTVRTMVDEARSWREENLDPDQAEATKFYMGRPIGNEEEGRSKVVMTIVRDTVQAIMPSLMRIFFGSDRIVEFVPKGIEDAELAEQQTDYINHVVVQQDNDGFTEVHAAIKDALVRRIGIFKWWWEKSDKVEGQQLSGITDDEVQALMADPSVEDVEFLDEGVVEIPNQAPMMVSDVEIVRRSDAGRARFAAIPPEEFFFTPDARDIDEAAMVAHVRDISASDVIAMGVDPDLVKKHINRKVRSRDVGDGELWDARRITDEGAVTDSGEKRSEADGLVRFGEVFVRFDQDEDDIAEMLMVPIIGMNSQIIEEMVEVVAERPFALLTPDPEPHTMVGLSTADYTMDLQKIMSAIVRAMLDSLTLALHPRMEADINKVNVEDLLNEEMGAVIRSDGIGNIAPIKHEFVGAAALPVLQYFGEVKENRTGISKAASGLAPDALQSSTRAAVAATVEGGRQHIEMIARVFAETGFKRLFRGLFKLVKENQDRERVVRLRGKFVAVDPRDWDAEMDVVVNVALGGATREEKLQLLTQIIADQKAQIQNGSPLVDLTNLRTSLAQAVELAGFRNPDAFYKTFGQAELEEHQKQLASQPPQPDAEMALVEVEKMRAEAEIALNQQKAQLDMQVAQLDLQMKQSKLQADAAIAAAKVELAQQQAAAKDDLERDKLAQDFALKQAEIEARFTAQLRNSELQADVQRGNAQQGENPEIGG